ncbi:hypothetical protein M9H77_13199 [Catharanthus roseus]|uniref:Uncharacterized protein n=1 Tax=Catharanthus roseus TaxID=4058 RepID=A0ACC0BJI5_CATRO|nr:hypothetical protein M9H77_13199 [Catharanthus roseus]
MMGGTTIQLVSIITEQLIQIEQFRKSHVSHVIFYDFSKNKIAQKIYNVVAKFKNNRMQTQWILQKIKHLYFSSVVSTRKEQDGGPHEPCVIIIDRESGLMSVIEDVFSTAYHILCKRHIDQNVLAKLTEMIKDEEVTSHHEAMAFNMPW